MWQLRTVLYARTASTRHVWNARPTKYQIVRPVLSVGVHAIMPTIRIASADGPPRRKIHVRFVRRPGIQLKLQKSDRQYQHSNNQCPFYNSSNKEYYADCTILI